MGNVYISGNKYEKVDKNMYIDICLTNGLAYRPLYSNKRVDHIRVYKCRENISRYIKIYFIDCCHYEYLKYFSQDDDIYITIIDEELLISTQPKSDCEYKYLIVENNDRTVTNAHISILTSVTQTDINNALSLIEHNGGEIVNVYVGNISCSSGTFDVVISYKCTELMIGNILNDLNRI